MSERPILMIVGPTASGKSAWALDEALRVGGEIVSADSRQVYRRLDIGTAKPSREEQARVPHHFIDERDVWEPFSAGTFAREAEDRIASVLARGRVPIVAGGSTLYLSALVHGVAEIPAVRPETRAAVEARLASEGLASLVAELQRVDPDLAGRIDSLNPRRVARALEVFLETGVPLSMHQRRHTAPRYSYDVRRIERTRSDLHARIEARVDAMLRDGLVREVEALAADGLDRALAPLQTIGYVEVFRHLDGALTFDEMRAEIIAHTRQYARRQETYFRKYLPGQLL